MMSKHSRYRKRGLDGRELMEDLLTHTTQGELKPHLTTHCRLWKGWKDEGGYAKIFYKDRDWKGHRLLYALANNYWPEDHEKANHDCDQPLCVNPDHIYMGSQADNMRDMRERGRMPVGEDRPNSKLKARDIPRIRRLAAEGVGRQKIADMFNVGRTTINDVVNRRTWTCVD